ncbi:hypothetical protein ABID26_006746 [Mesorhizobium shonense]|uniref:Uncharacterized protein n=1 Tax=Mesorhizobium shonense TaxID=1209948 RepID=A0ABV2I4S8_9HYPH
MSSFQGEAGAKLRRGDPGIHAVTLAEERSGAEFCTFATLGSHGMDLMVCAASLRSVLRQRMTTRGTFRPISKATETKAVNPQ